MRSVKGFFARSAVFSLAFVFALFLSNSVGAATNVSNCSSVPLSSADTYYVLNASLNATADVFGATCLMITANNVTLDCVQYGMQYEIYGNNSGGSYGIFVNSANDVFIKNCKINRFDYGIFIFTALRANVSWSNVSYCADNIRAGDSSDGQILHNTVLGPSDRGVNLFGNVDNFLVKNNTVDSTAGTGAVFVGGSMPDDYSDSNVIFNNTVTSSVGGVGLGFRHRYTNVSYNTITGSGSANPVANEVGAAIIQGNTITSASGYGIISDSGADWTNITRNNITSGNNSLKLDNVANNTVTDNDFTSTSANASALDCNWRNIFSRNKFTGFDRGIYITAGSCTSYNNLFVENTISGSTQDVSLLGQAAQTVLNTTFINCTFDKTKTTVAGTAVNLTVKWYVDIHVIDVFGNNLTSANLNISNSRNTSIQFEAFNLTTNSTGWIPRQNVTEYIQNTSGIINFTPHYIAASKSGVQNVTQNNYVTQSSTFTIVLPALAGCGYLGAPNTYYALAQNLSSPGATCFTIAADNITLDCVQYSVTGDLSPNTYGVLVNITNNTLVKNCVITKFAIGINASGNASGSFNTTITANNVSYNSKGIRVLQSYNGTISDNVKILGMSDRGMELFGNVDYFIVRNNSVESWAAEGIFVGGTADYSLSEYNTIYNNTVSLNGSTLGQGGLDAGWRSIYNNFSSNVVNATNNGYGIVNENANTFDSNIITAENGLGIINGWTSAGWSNYSNNQITSGNTSLKITNNVDNCLFYNNVFTSTASNATELMGSATTLNNFFSNTFTGNAYGIYFNSAPSNKFVDSIISGITGDLFLNGSSYDNLFINTTFDKSKATVADAGSNFTVQWYLGVRVLDDSNAAVSGAAVNATSANGTVLFALSTDSSGYAATQNVSEYFQTSGGVTNFTPHLLSASKNPSNTSTIQLTQSKNAVVVLTYALTISNVHIIDVTQNTVTIGWDTSRAANETIEYGLTASYGSTYTNAGLATTHSAYINSLIASTTYHYRIQACGTGGLCVYSADNTFTTAGGSGGGTSGGSSGGYIPAPTPTIIPTVVASPSASETPTVQPSPIGGEKDAHGCLVAAGYSWCEAKQKCLRIWEEPCVVASASPSATAVVPQPAPVSGSISSWLILLLVLILLLFAFFLYKRRKKRGS